MSASFDRDVWAILGMPIDNVTLDEAAALIERAVETRERLSFVTPNVNWMVRALKEPKAMRQIIQADLSLADGWPVVWLARKLGMPLKERAAGADLFERLRSKQGTMFGQSGSFSSGVGLARQSAPMRFCLKKKVASSQPDGTIQVLAMSKA